MGEKYLVGLLKNKENHKEMFFKNGGDLVGDKTKATKQNFTDAYSVAETLKSKEYMVFIEDNKQNRLDPERLKKELGHQALVENITNELNKENNFKRMFYNDGTRIRYQKENEGMKIDQIKIKDLKGNKKMIAMICEYYMSLKEINEKD